MLHELIKKNPRDSTRITTDLPVFTQMENLDTKPEELLDDHVCEVRKKKLAERLN